MLKKAMRIGVRRAAQRVVWPSRRFLRTQCAPRQLFRITRGDDGEHRGNARYQAELTKKPEPQITRNRQADRLLRVNSSPEHVKCAVTRSARLANKICFVPKRRNSCYTQLARARPGADYAHVFHSLVRDANIELLFGKKLYN